MKIDNYRRTIWIIAVVGEDSIIFLSEIESINDHLWFQGVP